MFSGIQSKEHILSDKLDLKLNIKQRAQEQLEAMLNGS